MTFCLKERLAFLTQGCVKCEHLDTGLDDSYHLVFSAYLSIAIAMAIEKLSLSCLSVFITYRTGEQDQPLIVLQKWVCHRPQTMCTVCSNIISCCLLSVVHCCLLSLRYSMTFVLFSQCHSIHRTIVDTFKYALVWVSTINSHALTKT